MSARRREAARQAVGDELEQALRLGQVLEVVCSEVAQRGGLRAISEQPGRPLGHDHLTAVRRGGDPRGAMDVDPDVVAVCDERLAGVQAYAYLQRRVFRPGMSRELALRLLGRRERLARVNEGDEEAVALGIDLDAAVPRKGRPQ